jgi:Tfp pilus assembly protein FimT
MIAVPSFRAMVEKGRLRGATDDVVNLLGVARAEAIKRQRSVAVALGGASTSDWCIGANRAPDPTAPTGTVSGLPTLGATACDCTTPTQCVLENQISVVKPPVVAGASAATINQITGSIIFNAQTGAMIPVTDPVAADASYVFRVGGLTLTSSSGLYSLQIKVSPLGQVVACVPAGGTFISGYQSC